jgi:hypothetical protein
MPKPQIDPELLAGWNQELSAAEVQLEHLVVNPVLHAKLHEIGLAGKWLKHVLVSDNTPPDKVTQFFALFCQKAFGVQDVWELAVKTFDAHHKFQEFKKNPPYTTVEVPLAERDELLERLTRVHSE